MARHVEFDQEKIIDRAQDLYWQKGYEATSVQDLVDHLGISRSSLYNTFEDKYGLYLQALTCYQQTNLEGLQQVVAAYGYSKKTIEHIFNTSLERVLNDQTYRGCFLANSLVERAKYDDAVAELVMSYQLMMQDVLHKSIIAAQEDGEMGEVSNPLALARHLNSVLIGLNVMAKAHPDPQMLKDIVVVALEMLN